MATKDEAAEVTEIAMEATMSVGAVTLFDVGFTGCLLYDVRMFYPERDGRDWISQNVGRVNELVRCSGHSAFEGR